MPSAWWDEDEADIQTLLDEAHKQAEAEKREARKRRRG